MQVRSNRSIENQRNGIDQASEDDTVDGFTPCQTECNDRRRRLPPLRIDRIRDPESQNREGCPGATLDWGDIGVNVAPFVWISK